MFAYHLGDLDEFHFPFCQWAADYHQRARIEEAVLIYNGPSVATVMAFGLTDRFEAFLNELIDLLPQKFLGHYQKEHRSLFHQNYREDHLGIFWKMKLIDTTIAQATNSRESKNVIRLEAAHANELEKMYVSAYPDGYFERRMLQTGKYFGYLHDGRIVSVAGVHVDSEEHSVSVLGSIATLPEFRGKGLATAVTARLIRELVPQTETITLNVDSANPPAVKCYSKLGFEKTHEYEEGVFTRKK